jgi:DNA-binding protein YbaB
VCSILMEDDSENSEDSLAPEDKAMLSKFLVAALRVAKEDPTAESRSKMKGKKVPHHTP